MTPDSRLTEDGADAFEAKLLRSARGDGASADRQRTLTALGLLAGASGAAGGAPALKAKGPFGQAIRRVGPLRLMAVVGLGLAGGVAGLAAFRHHAPPTEIPPAQVAPATGTAVPATRVEMPPAPREPPPQHVADAPRAHVVKPATKPRSPAKATPAHDDDSLLEEASILDRARLQLSQHDGAGARKTAEDYLARFPRGRLAAEAEVVRIHATLLTDGRAAAAPLAQAFLRAHPDSPHAPALRRILAP